MIRSRLFYGVVHDMRHFCDNSKKINWQVISDPEYLADTRRIPLELQYALAIHPSRAQFIKTMISRGHGLALGRYPQADPEVLKAISIISSAYHGALHPWLEDLVVKNVTPVFSESDLDDATLRGMDLLEQVSIIKNRTSELIQIKIIESGEQTADLEDKKLVAAMARDIQKIHSVQAVETLYCQSIHRKQHTLLLFAVGLLLIAPIIHILEMAFSGLGKFMAVVLPNLFIQSLLAQSAYRHGDAFWQIKNRLKGQWPEMIFLLAGAFSVELVFSFGLSWLAGLIFALSANALLIGRGLRKLFKSKKIFSILVSQGKIPQGSSISWAKIFYGPLWAAYLLGFILTIAITGIVFSLFPAHLSNGWLLFALAASYYLFSELLATVWLKTTAHRFKNRLRTLLRKAIIS